MEKKKKKRRLDQVIYPEVTSGTEISPKQTSPDSFDDPVSIVTFITEKDRFRLKKYALEKRTSLQRLGHQAWNALLISQNLPILTYMSAGKTRNKRSKR